MNLLLSIIFAAVLAYISYLIALALPFLAAHASLVGLIVFVLVLLSGFGGRNSLTRS